MLCRVAHPDFSEPISRSNSINRCSRLMISSFVTVSASEARAVAPDRDLAPDDILAYVARQWQTVVVGTVTGGAADDPIDFLTRYRPDQIEKLLVPAIRSDGSVSAMVPTVLIRASGVTPRHDRAEPAPASFSLDGDIFERSQHRDLVRVFVPIGLDPNSRAIGVLEAGHHRSHNRLLDRTSIEALLACASQVATAWGS